MNKEKYPKNFIEETIKLWQPFSNIHLTSQDAIEITDNMVSLLNFLITIDRKNNQENPDENMLSSKNRKEAKCQKGNIKEKKFTG